MEVGVAHTGSSCGNRRRHCHRRYLRLALSNTLSCRPILLADLRLPTLAAFTRMTNVDLLVDAVAVAFIATAETMLTATALDKLAIGHRTKYDKEMKAQGVGNMLCGLIGVLPMTGVIVRSGVNVRAGARTRRVFIHAWAVAAVVRDLCAFYRAIGTFFQSRGPFGFDRLQTGLFLRKRKNCASSAKARCRFSLSLCRRAPVAARRSRRADRRERARLPARSRSRAIAATMCRSSIACTSRARPTSSSNVTVSSPPRCSRNSSSPSSTQSRSPSHTCASARASSHSVKPSASSAVTTAAAVAWLHPGRPARRTACRSRSRSRPPRRGEALWWVSCSSLCAAQCPKSSGRAVPSSNGSPARGDVVEVQLRAAMHQVRHRMQRARAEVERGRCSDSHQNRSASLMQRDLHRLRHPRHLVAQGQRLQKARIDEHRERRGERAEQVLLPERVDAVLHADPGVGLGEHRGRDPHDPHALGSPSRRRSRHVEHRAARRRSSRTYADPSPARRASPASAAVAAPSFFAASPPGTTIGLGLSESRSGRAPAYARDVVRDVTATPPRRRRRSPAAGGDAGAAPLQRWQTRRSALLGRKDALREVDGVLEGDRDPLQMKQHQSRAFERGHQPVKLVPREDPASCRGTKTSPWRRTAFLQCWRRSVNRAAVRPSSPRSP